MSKESGRRLKSVLETVFAGNITVMANALGVDKSTCSRYVSGDTVPSRTVLLLLHEAHGIDLGWLEEGSADEVQWSGLSSSTAVRELGLPVFAAPLESVPQPKSPGFLDKIVVVSPTFFKSTSYWVEIDRADPGESLARGDLVLIEPEKARAPEPSDPGRLLVVRRGTGLALQRWTEDGGKGRKKAESVEIVGKAVLVYRKP